MTDTIEDARRLIESRLAEIETEAGHLERAIAGLGERGVRKARPDRRPKATAPVAGAGRRARKPTRDGRAPRGLRREELLAAIEAGPGARPSALAESIGIRPTQVHALIAKARAEKLIVRRGEGYALKG